MNKRLGAALVVVLALLAIALMVGLSMMQSSQLDERLAGNYRAQADAQMGAEKAACAGFGALEGPDDFVSVSLSLAEFSSLGWQGFGNDAEFNGQVLSPDACSGNVECHYRYARIGGVSYILAMGAVSDDEAVIAVSEPITLLVLEDYLVPGFADFDPITLLGNVEGFSHTNSRPFTISRAGDDNEGYSIAVQNPGDVEEITFSANNEGNHAAVDDELVQAKQYSDEELAQIAALVDFAKYSHHSNVKYYGGSCALRVGEEQEGDVLSCYGDGESSGGLLVVDGDFYWDGYNYFEGVILVRGENIIYNGGGSGSLRGALVHLPANPDGQQTADGFDLGDSNVTMNGGGASAFVHDPDILSELEEGWFGGDGSGGCEGESRFRIYRWE